MCNGKNIKTTRIVNTLYIAHNHLIIGRVFLSSSSHSLSVVIVVGSIPRMEFIAWSLADNCVGCAIVGCHIVSQWNDIKYSHNNRYCFSSDHRISWASYDTIVTQIHTHLSYIVWSLYRLFFFSLLCVHYDGYKKEIKDHKITHTHTRTSHT